MCIAFKQIKNIWCVNNFYDLLLMQTKVWTKMCKFENCLSQALNVRKSHAKELSLAPLDALLIGMAITSASTFAQNFSQGWFQ